MSVLTKKAVDIFAPVKADGTPRPVSNADAQVWGSELETLIGDVITMGGKIYASKAQLDADLSPEANTPALVIGDTIPGNNGLYQKIGLSGTGSWQRIGDVPGYQIIPLTNTGEGTANALRATSALPVPQADRSAILLLNVVAPNSGAMTLSVNAESARPLVTNSGQDINPTYVRTGMVLALVKEGVIYRLLSDVASAAIQEAAEAARVAAEVAKNAAEHARDLAANYANDALAGGMEPGISVRAAVPELQIPEGITHFRTAGFSFPGDGGAALYKRVTSEPAHAGKVQSADGSWWELTSHDVCPEMFGARGDGVTDDTDAIAHADAFCRSFSPSKWLVFGAKTYIVSQMVIHPFSKWKGQGKDGTIIRQIVGSNRTLIYGLNSEENFPLTDPTNYAPFPYDFEVDGFDLDGNWNDGAGNISGHGFFVLGDHYNVRNLYVRNCAECGVVKKFVGDHPDNYDSRYLETSFKHIRVDYVGKHGFLDFGPHDSLHEDIIVLDAGQSTGNTFDGFNHNGSSSRNIAIHAATRSGRERMRYAVSTWNGSMNEWSGGSNIEGAETANLGLFSSGNQFDPSTRFYAAWGGVNIALGGASCTLNIIRGALQGPANGRPACIGVKFSSNSGDVIAQNDIDLLMSDQDAGAFQFDVGNKGGNRIRAKVYTTANVGVFGAVNPLDEVLIRGTVNANSRYELNNMEQSVFLASIPAGGSYTWIFPFEFRQSPNVQITPVLPSAALTLPLWVSGLTTTSVQIFNPNSNDQPVNVLATGVY